MKLVPDLLVLSGVKRGYTDMRRPSAHECSSCHSTSKGIFCDLNNSVLGELSKLRQCIMYPPGSVVFMEGEQARAAYCICSGRLKRSSSSAEGRVLIHGFSTPGDVLGVRALLLGKPHDLTAEAVEATELCLFPKDEFIPFIKQNGDISLRVAQKLSLDLYEAYRRVRGTALKGSSERLAELLLRLCHSHGKATPKGISLDANLCQDELAALLGISRRSLNRLLAELRVQGVIECRRRSILVRNITALRKRLSLVELPA